MYRNNTQQTKYLIVCKLMDLIQLIGNKVYLLFKHQVTTLNVKRHKK